MRNFHSSTLVKATIITGVQAAHELDGSVIVETEDGLMQVSAALTAPRVPNVGDIVVMDEDGKTMQAIVPEDVFRRVSAEVPAGFDSVMTVLENHERLSFSTALLLMKEGFAAFRPGKPPQKIITPKDDPKLDAPIFSFQNVECVDCRCEMESEDIFAQDWQVFVAAQAEPTESADACTGHCTTCDCEPESAEGN